MEIPKRNARTVRLGGRDVVRIGLGTNRLSDSPEHVAFVRAAVEAGIELVDTAHTYAGGQSEAVIGTALDPGRGAVSVATKGGYAPGHGRPEILRTQIEASLDRLRTDTLDLYYLHRVDPETALEDSLGTIREYVDRGQIRLVGLSQVDVEVIEQARQVMPIAAVQNHYSLQERRYDEVVDHCAREGIVFVPFFPLRGVAGPELDRVARRHAVTPTQVALAWLLRRSPAMLPIPGSLSLDHVRENLAALDVELTDEEFETLA
jgi:pyridoxine 4-dehydrogenase